MNQNSCYYTQISDFLISLFRNWKEIRLFANFGIINQICRDEILSNYSFSFK